MKNLAQRIASLTPQQRALLELKRRQREEARPRPPRIPKRQGTGPWPATTDQTALWFFQEFDPQTSAYNIATALRLTGRLDVGLLEKATERLCGRHEILRTVFQAIGGVPYQVILPGLRLSIPIIDRSDAADREEAVQSEASKIAKIPFNLDIGPLIRLVLVRFDELHHVLIVVMHHSTTDWWSHQIFYRDLFAYYHAELGGKEIKLPEMPVQFADYALWREGWLRGEEARQQLDYWRGKLQDAPFVLEVPTDRPRPKVQSANGARQFFTLPDEATQGVRLINRRAGASSFMTLLAAIYVLIHRYTGQTDQLIGTPVSADREIDETANLIGYLLNTVVLRGQLKGDPTFLQLLEQVRTTVLEGFENKELPFRSIVEELKPERDISRMPLYQIEFLYVNPEGSMFRDSPEVWKSMEIPGLRTESFNVDRKTSPVDMQISFTENYRSMEFLIEYNTDLYRADTIRRMGRRMTRFLAGLADNAHLPCSGLPWLSDEERREVLDLACGPAVPADSPLGDADRLDALFRRSCARNPESAALIFEDEELSYAQLSRRVDALALRLRAKGIESESLVGISMSRTPDLIVALLAVLSAGGAYVPLDPDYPSERLRFISRDSGISLLLGDSEQRPSWLDAQVEVMPVGSPQTPDATNLAATRDWAGADDLAYVIYTSGSTGKPKGVAIAHGAGVRFLQAMACAPGLGRSERLLAVTTVSFDIALLEILLPLSLGATVVLASKETASDAGLLADAIESNGITAMQATPATWRMLLSAGWKGRSGLKVLCGGEALPADLAEQLQGVCGQLWNLYGPTEATVWSTRSLVGEQGITIGSPIEGDSIYILDGSGRICPTGVPGELLIGGQGLARGYWRRSALTAERFIPDRFSQSAASRLYRSGDRARWLNDGQIEFLGRLDHQVKVRGFRIELGEVEHHLLRFPGVVQAKALARPVEGKEAELTAYLVLEDDANPEWQTEIRASLRQSLPDYMLPTVFIDLEQMPLTPSGKIDVRALPEPQRKASRAAYVAPRTPTEEILAGIWSEVLGIERISVADNFFDLGGHSLLATQILSRTADSFEVSLTLQSVFDDPSLAAMAERIDSTRWAMEELQAPTRPLAEDEEEGEI